MIEMQKPARKGLMIELQLALHKVLTMVLLLYTKMEFFWLLASDTSHLSLVLTGNRVLHHMAPNI